MRSNADGASAENIQVSCMPLKYTSPEATNHIIFLFLLLTFRKRLKWEIRSTSEHAGPLLPPVISHFFPFLLLLLLPCRPFTRTPRVLPHILSSFSLPPPPPPPSHFRPARFKRVHCPLLSSSPLRRRTHTQHVCPCPFLSQTRQFSPKKKGRRHLKTENPHVATTDGRCSTFGKCSFSPWEKKSDLLNDGFFPYPGYSYTQQLSKSDFLVHVRLFYHLQRK